MHGKRSFSSTHISASQPASGKRATTYRAAAALEEVLGMFADPIARRLKVTSGLRAGGLDVGNHSRNGLVVRRG